MKALVTGAAGFVGGHLMEALRERQIEAFGVDARWPHELTSPWPDVDVIFSLAASADPREALKDPELAYTNSVHVMVQTLEHARDCGARVLHVSTNEVYGDDRYGPRGPYAGAKLCQEIICGTYRPEVQVTAVVTQSLFGEDQQPDKLVPTVIRKLLADEPIHLQRNGEKWASRPFFYVGNLVEGLIHLAEEPRWWDRVHLGASELVSVREVVDVLADELGVEAQIEAVPAGDRPGHELNVEPIGCSVSSWKPRYEAIPALRAIARATRECAGSF